MEERPYKIGSRGSALAKRQSCLVLRELQTAFPENQRLVQAQVVYIQTTGDKIKDQPLADIGGKVLFCKELQQALINNEIDFAIHSLKDLEHTSPKGLTIGAVLKREDYRDVLITSIKKPNSILGLTPNSKIGTCSPRRAAQLLHFRPDLEIVPLRGNVLTRLQKLEEENLDGIILALAGLKRLGIWSDGKPPPEDYHHLYFQVLESDLMLPAVGQGVLAVECRKDNIPIMELLAAINHQETFSCIQAERSLLKELGGNCHTAISALATVTPEKKILLTSAYFPDYTFKEKGLRKIFTQQTAPIHQSVELGRRTAKYLKTIVNS